MNRIRRKSEARNGGLAEGSERLKSATELKEAASEKREYKLGPLWEEPDMAPKFTFHLRPRLIQLNHPCKLICCVQGKPAPVVRHLSSAPCPFTALMALVWCCR